MWEVVLSMWSGNVAQCQAQIDEKLHCLKLFIHSFWTRPGYILACCGECDWRPGHSFWLSGQNHITDLKYFACMFKNYGTYCTPDHPLKEFFLARVGVINIWPVETERVIKGYTNKNELNWIQQFNWSSLREGQSTSVKLSRCYWHCLVLVCGCVCVCFSSYPHSCLLCVCCLRARDCTYTGVTR